MTICVRGKRWLFEMHPFCGPMLVNDRGDALKKEPIHVLEAISLWAQQGRRMEAHLCRWDHEPEPILKHLGGRNFKIVGENPPRRGE